MARPAGEPFAPPCRPAASSARAACTNSEFFSEMICPRTMRASVSQLTRARQTKRLMRFRPKMAMKMMTRSM